MKTDIDETIDALFETWYDRSGYGHLVCDTIGSKEAQPYAYNAYRAGYLAAAELSRQLIEAFNNIEANERALERSRRWLQKLLKELTLPPEQTLAIGQDKFPVEEL